MGKSSQIMVDDLSKAPNDGDTSDSVSLKEESLKGAKKRHLRRLEDSDESDDELVEDSDSDDDPLERRHLLNHSRTKIVAKLVSQLGFKGKFNPLSERDYDDLMDEWVDITVSMNFENEDLKGAIISLADPDVRRVIVKSDIKHLPTRQFINVLATKLFPHSKEIQAVVHEIRQEKRVDNPKSAIHQVKKLRRRYMMFV